MSAQPAGWYQDPHDASQLRYWSGVAWTAYRSPRFQAPSPAAGGWRAPAPAGPTGKWYFLITILSGGLLAVVPFFHAASRLDRPHLRKVGAAMTAGAALGFVLLEVSPTDANGDATGWTSSAAVIILMTVMLVASLILIGPRREVYQPSAVARPPTGNQGAMASIEAARRARDEARKLAIRDPMMARELGIGRPGSSTGYQDGGLLELNSATAEQLGAVCGLPPEMAEAVVVARADLGRFQSVEDVIMFGQIGEEHVPMVRDRGIVIADR